MGKKQKIYSADIKARVASEALRGQKTVAQSVNTQRPHQALGKLTLAYDELSDSQEWINRQDHECFLVSRWRFATS